MRLQEAIRHSGIKCDGINLFLADGEVANREQLFLGVLTNSPTVGKFDVAVFLGGLFEGSLDLRDGLRALLPPQRIEVVLAIQALVTRYPGTCQSDNG